MAQLSKNLKDLMEQKGWDVKTTARELRVSRASLYNYLNKDDLPRMEVLQRAHKKWGWNLKYWNYDLDDSFFENLPKEIGPPKETQIPLPFIESLRTEDVEVVAVIPRKPNAVEVNLKIRFAAQ